MNNTMDCDAGISAKQNELSQIRTAITELEMVKSEITQLAHRIVGRLCGATPDCERNMKGVPSNGAFGEIKNSIIEIREDLNTALDDLKRLDREIGE